MIPRTYIETIVVPTLKEFLADRGSRRRGYLACITIVHTVDYLAGGDRGATEALFLPVQTLCGPSFEVVHSVANGTKHAGGHRARWHRPGSERAVKAFGFGPGYAGFEEGRWDFPGLEVARGGGKLFIDLCAQVVLLTLCALHPEDLGGVDLAFLDADVLRGPPEPWNNYFIVNSNADDWMGGLRGPLP